MRPARFLAPLALALAACSDAVAPGGGDLLERLNALPGVTATEIPSHYGYPRQFALDITQPVDHDRPNGPTFTQRAYLSHADEDLPMVFGPNGYGATEESWEELAFILQCNGVYVTHRYFPGSRPQPTDWRYLDIRQAAADHHRIVVLLEAIYPGPWVSAGSSKSGMTALFHRRFWPDDVDATVAYVAPLMFDVEDERFLPWLAARLARPIARAQVTDLDAVPGDVVVNATGLGARILAGDPTVTGLAGQVVVTAPGDADLTVSLADDRDPDAMFYAIPRLDSLVLGGSAVAAAGDEPPPEDAALTARILADAARFGLHPGPVLAVRRGLRPFRPTVRLERTGRILHCYGHGGAGYTLCLGCVEDLAAQV